MGTSTIEINFYIIAGTILTNIMHADTLKFTVKSYEEFGYDVHKLRIFTTQLAITCSKMFKNVPLSQILFIFNFNC